MEPEIDHPLIESTKLISSGARALNRKRTYTQYHLEYYGQSDFLFHGCPTCGFKHACGDEVDEKVHMEFHKNYCRGVRFKVEELVEFANKDILDVSENRLLHAHFEVYLFISRQTIAGILVAEPIQTAHMIISNLATKVAATNEVVTSKISNDKPKLSSRLSAIRKCCSPQASL